MSVGADGKLDGQLVFVGMLVILALVVGLGVCLGLQYSNYQQAIALAKKIPCNESVLGVLLSSRAWDSAVYKTTALFLAFILIFLGALYVLRTAVTQYSVAGEGSGLKASLSTSSPGLVMVTLGVILVGFVIWYKVVLDYKPGVCWAANSQPLATASGEPIDPEVVEGQLRPVTPGEMKYFKRRK